MGKREEATKTNRFQAGRQPLFWKRALFMMIGLAALSPVRAQFVPQVGDLCVYQVVPISVTFGRFVARRSETSKSATYKSHPIHGLLNETRPGVLLDAHSKALLKLQPDAPLLATKGDSTYFVKPGFNAVHLATEGRVRRTNLILDSLFRIPIDKYRYGYEVVLDTFLGKLPDYLDGTSRILGVWRFFMEGQSKIAVLVSNDYLQAVRRSEPVFAVAIFSPGLVLEDLIRFPSPIADFLSPVPHLQHGTTFVWENEGGAGAGIQIVPNNEEHCVPNDAAVVNEQGTEEWPKQQE